VGRNPPRKAQSLLHRSRLRPQVSLDPDLAIDATSQSLVKYMTLSETNTQKPELIQVDSPADTSASPEGESQPPVFIPCPVISAILKESDPVGFDVQLSDLKACFHGESRPCLQNINLHVEPGERVAILGPSGAGKSTLLSMITGLYQPSEGCVHFNGTCWNDMSKEEKRHTRRRIGKIYQDFRLVPQKTALQNVLSGYLGFLPTWRTVFGYPKPCYETAERLLKSIGLEEKTDLAVRRLSGGEKQRVALARAMAQEPGLLLADEPTASLDYQAAITILREINAVAARGVTVIAVMHDIELAEALAPRAILMENGRIVYDGPSKDLRTTMEDILGWTSDPRIGEEIQADQGVA
jgi:phosphonate transport system ATP-binding protein